MSETIARRTTTSNRGPVVRRVEQLEAALRHPRSEPSSSIVLQERRSYKRYLGGGSMYSALNVIAGIAGDKYQGHMDSHARSI